MLETREDYNKTNVCITSDHGDMLGDYGMLYKSTLLEQAAKGTYDSKQQIERQKRLTMIR